MKVDYDASLGAFVFEDISGDESQVIYCPDGYMLGNNPFYLAGMAKKKFIVISQEIEGVRKNTLLLASELTEVMKVSKFTEEE